MSAAPNTCRLSVALVVRDAAEALRETLLSVRDIADELVVLDTGSTDASLAVAAELGAQVFSHTWQDDFSDARNACQRHVTGDWVLWLDAGEQLEADDAAALREFINGGVDIQTAYALLVHVPASGQASAGEQVARLRLVPNHPDIQHHGRIRETISDSLESCGIRVDALPYRIQRGPREHDPATKKDKAHRNLRICDLEIRERGAAAHLFNCLGDALQTLGEDRRAEECYRHALSASANGSLDMLEAYYGLLTSMDGDKKNRETQLALCVKGLDTFPLDAQLLCAMGGYLHGQGRADLALKAYETAYRYGQVSMAVWHVDEIREIAAICYAIGLQLDGRSDEAAGVLGDAAQASPGCVRLRRHLLEFHVKRGERDEALQQVGQLPKDTPHIEALRSAVRGACLAAQKNWVPAKAYLKTAYAAGCRDVLCLRWLSTAHLMAGELEEARPLLKEWLTCEPRNPDATRYLAAIEASDAQPAGERQLRVDGGSPHVVAPPSSVTSHKPAANRRSTWP